jgi:catechol 2,3-dioxygenase-like lactoylglutathione lyase family enzyme
MSRAAARRLRAMTAPLHPDGRLHLVMVPSTDPDRSVAFYEALGFRRRADFAFAEGERWIELFPPGGTAGIALSGRAARGGAGVATGIILSAPDLDAAHAALRAAGADVDAQVARPGSDVAIRVGEVDVVGPTPAMFGVRDPDGNGLLVVQA